MLCLLPELICLQQVGAVWGADGCCLHPARRERWFRCPLPLCQWAAKAFLQVGLVSGGKSRGECKVMGVCVQGEVSLVKFSQLGGICVSAAPELQSTVWFYSWRDWAALSL